MTRDPDPIPDAADALAHARHALERLRASLGEGAFGRIAALGAEIEKAVADNEALKAAHTEIIETVRRRPLTALAIAFGAGLALALLTRG
jgi:ferric-dicitrate binding protein FerR (iron transport regulator)